MHDVPAQVDKVRELSGNDKITYIGHSQGTTQMFYALAHNQAKLLEKVNLFAALAPVTVITAKAGLTHFPGGTFAECEIRKQVGNLAGIWDIFPSEKMHKAMRIADNLA